MTDSQIYFHSEVDDFNLVNPEKYILWFKDAAELEKKKLSLLNFVFCNDEYLVQINRDYLGHDYYTDIISFPLKEDPIEGDIFISIDRIRENAQEYNVTFEEELKRVMIHGLLHFFGYDDHEDAAIKTMREKRR